MGIPGPSPLFIFGNFFSMAKGLIKCDSALIGKYGKMCGYFEGSRPIILTTDVKFIKSFAIKDFSCFINRRVWLLTLNNFILNIVLKFWFIFTWKTFDVFSIDPFDKTLLVLKDEEWRNVRSIVSTTFTSGKLKSVIFFY